MTTTLSEQQNQLSCFPYSVGNETEGVCILVQLGEHRILLDCGLKDIQPLTVGGNPPVEMVFCSHAHSDHAQGLLALHQAYPQLPMYASEVTVELLPLNWLELAPPSVPQFCQGIPWRSPLQLAEDLTVELYPAGHLPGAACTLLTYKTPKRSYKLMYTGDFCLSNFQLVEGLSIETLRGLGLDVLIIEGSYGNARHPHRRQQEKQLMETIKEAIVRKKNVLLPVPTLGIGQEILKLLRSHHQFTGQDLDIWVDGSVAITCDYYLELLSQFPASVQNFAKHQPLFWDDRVCPRMRRLSAENLSRVGLTSSIVIADYRSDLQQYCQNESDSWLILLPEHPRLLLTPDSPQLKNLVKNPQITMQTYLLAEHSDGRNTTQLIHNLRPQHVVFVHAPSTYLSALTGLEELQNRYQLHSPPAGHSVELPIGDNFIRPAVTPHAYYEGELNEIAAFITITLPDEIERDPRWNGFADTGIVEARWQGDELILRGVSQRELQSKTSFARRITEIDCCSNCLHYRNQRCWNAFSPLYGFVVTPDGYCPVFESSEDSNQLWE